MSYTQERERFFARMAREGWTEGLTRAVLRDASTLQRLAVAQCNGAWPADNGERDTDVCGLCGGAWAPSVLKTPEWAQDGAGKRYACPDCRISRQLLTRLQDETAGAWTAKIAGDPRGYVVKVYRASETREDVECGRAKTVVGVPARG